jgi:glucose-1-phosphate cytidylyltransferase
MKLVILAGGLGTRISEETNFIPKPMIKIGSKPIIWHIMKYYASYGVSDFIICGGYKINKIKSFFKVKKNINKWNVKIIDTGKNSNTGERIKKIQKEFINNETFFLTYGDGLSNINIRSLLSLHNKKKSLLTISAVKPPARFGNLIIKNNKVKSFYEKKKKYENWISGGFFVCNSKIFHFFKKNNPIFEKEIIPVLVKKGLAAAYMHRGFWHPMDTIQEKRVLTKLWRTNAAPWKV